MPVQEKIGVDPFVVRDPDLLGGVVVVPRLRPVIYLSFDVGSFVSTTEAASGHRIPTLTRTSTPTPGEVDPTSTPTVSLNFTLVPAKVALTLALSTNLTYLTGPPTVTDLSAIEAGRRFLPRENPVQRSTELVAIGRGSHRGVTTRFGRGIGSGRGPEWTWRDTVACVVIEAASTRDGEWVRLASRF